jgi:hypothetical protein
MPLKFMLKAAVLARNSEVDLAKRGFGLGFRFPYPPTGNPSRVLAFMNPPKGSWRVPAGCPKYPKIWINRE